MLTSMPVGVTMRSQITATRGPFGSISYLPSTFEPLGSSMRLPENEYTGSVTTQDVKPGWSVTMRVSRTQRM